jgi:hypothetical protein
MNRKQKINEEGLSSSSSHLVVNMKLVNGINPSGEALDSAIKTFSFLDIVGFNGQFYQKILDGHDFSTV